MANVKKKSKVVMLPTNEKADLQLWGKWLFYDKTQELSNREPKAIYQNLYFLSDEEIKEGDWVYDSITNTVWKWEKYTADEIDTKYNNKVFKIIATTDTSLKIRVFSHYSQDLTKVAVYKDVSLPHPSKQFIEKYIESYNSGNVIAEVMVEYEEILGDEGIIAVAFGEKDIKLKINPKDNTITISKCKDSWSREEVIELMQKSIIYGTELEAGAVEVDWKIDYKLKWIEENL